MLEICKSRKLILADHDLSPFDSDDTIEYLKRINISLDKIKDKRLYYGANTDLLTELQVAMNKRFVEFETITFSNIAFTHEDKIPRATIAEQLDPSKRYYRGNIYTSLMLHFTHTRGKCVKRITKQIFEGYSRQDESRIKQLLLFASRENNHLSRLSPLMIELIIHNIV